MSERTSRRPSTLALMVFGLLGVGIAQPLLDLYGSNPEVFIANRSSPSQIVLFAVVVTFVPTVVLSLVTVGLQHVLPAKRHVVASAAVAIAAFFAASSVLRHVFPDSNVAFALAVVLCAGVGYLQDRSADLRRWLMLLAALPILVLVQFFAFTKSGDLVFDEPAAAESAAVVGSDRPVVVLVMDELPVTSLLTETGQINERLFPNFARLAESSQWFKNAASNSIATADSVPIIASGILNPGATPTSADYPQTLFTLLGGRYDLRVNESVVELCPSSLCNGEGSSLAGDLVATTDGSFATLINDARVVYGHLAMAPIITDRLPSIDGQWGRFGDLQNTSGTDVVTTASKELPPAPSGGRPGWINKMLVTIDNVATSGSTTLHYTHIVAPHIPWVTNPSGSVYPRPEQTQTLVQGVEGGRWVSDPAYATQGFQRHLSQLGAVDTLLGLYIDELQRTGVWDDAIIVVTADHGASFKPGAHRRWVMGDNADELYRVPLFVRVPGRPEGIIREEAAFSIDILPTIIEALDISVAWDLDGMSLLGDLPQTRTHEFEHFTGDRLALSMDLATLDAELATNYLQITDTSSWEAIAAVGPFADAVGKPSSSLGVVEDASIISSVVGYDGPVEVDPDTGVVPSVITGRVTIPAGWDGSDLLLAVNGTVAGAAIGVRESGNTFVFSAYVAESAFIPGENAVGIVVAAPDGTFHGSVTGAVAAITYLDGSGNELDLITRGKRLVQIDEARFDGNSLHVEGFGADTNLKEPPDKILLYYGDDLVYEAAPNIERKDVPVWFSSENLVLTGFSVDLPADAVPSDLERVTAVAVFDGSAVVDFATVAR